jgi:hypothetical protein
MAKFGWAYINCSGASSDQTHGPAYSIQYVTSSAATSTTGSGYLTYHTGSATGFSVSTLILSGNMIITGTLSASVYNYENITIIDATGSTYFGNTDDDIHMRTGSLVVSNQAGTHILSASVGQKTVYVKGFAGNYTGVSTLSYAPVDGDYILGVTRGNYVTMSLPAPSSLNSGRVLLIKDEFKNRGTGSIFVTGAASGFLIDHASSYLMTGSNPAISLYSNGSNWFVF